RPGRPGDQTWAGWVAGHRVRRPTAAAGARPGGRVAAGRRHPARAAGTDRWGVRRPRRQGGAGERLPVSADGGASATATAVAPHPPGTEGSAGAGLVGVRARLPRGGGGRVPRGLGGGGRPGPAAARQAAVSATAGG